MHQACGYQVLVNGYIEDKIIKIIFVDSAENDSDILTKSSSTYLHEKHSKKIVGEKHQDFPSFKNI